VADPYNRERTVYLKDASARLMWIKLISATLHPIGAIVPLHLKGAVPGEKDHGCMGLVAPHLAVRRGKAVGSGIAEQMETRILCCGRR